MHLSDLRVTVADRVRQGSSRARAPEQYLVGVCGLGPVSVVARQQDFLALRVDVVDPELTARHRQRANQSADETARHILDDVGGKDVVEQFPPRRIRLGERHHRRLAALDRLDTGDEVVAGRVDDAGLTDHLAPQVPVVVGGDRRIVGPLRFRAGSCR